MDKIQYFRIMATDPIPPHQTYPMGPLLGTPEQALEARQNAIDHNNPGVFVEVQDASPWRTISLEELEKEQP